MLVNHNRSLAHAPVIVCNLVARVLAIDALAQGGARHSCLETLAVVLLTLSATAVAAFEMVLDLAALGKLSLMLVALVPGIALLS